MRVMQSLQLEQAPVNWIDFTMILLQRNASTLFTLGWVVMQIISSTRPNVQRNVLKPRKTVKSYVSPLSKLMWLFVPFSVIENMCNVSAQQDIRAQFIVYCNLEGKNPKCPSGYKCKVSIESDAAICCPVMKPSTNFFLVL